MFSQINTSSYLCQLQLILGFGGSETWAVSYLASFMLSNIYKGPKGRKSGHESCPLRSHLLNVSPKPSLGLFILSINQTVGWTKISKTWSSILKGFVWQSAQVRSQSLQAGILSFGKDPPTPEASVSAPSEMLWASTNSSARGTSPPAL